MALTAFVGGARQPAMACLPERVLCEEVATEARHLLGVRGVPVIVRTRFWMNGLPQYGMDHAAKLETLRATEDAYPGLFVTGNYLAGMSTTACIVQARLTASRAGAFLDGRPAATRPEPATVAGSAA